MPCNQSNAAAAAGWTQQGTRGSPLLLLQLRLAGMGLSVLLQL
jgi:hypothetical protein